MEDIIRFSILASGSKGNACYVETHRTRLLIDAGLSCRELERRLTAVGASPDRLHAIVLTHEHSDHIRGAGPLARRYGVPLITNSPTFESGRRILGSLPDLRLIQTGDSLTVEDLRIETFTKCHDAADPMGIVFASNGIKVGLATDLGRSTRLAEERLKACHALILEFNYDPDMLDGGPYPLHIKRRIKGPEGHLSNDQGGDLLGTLSHAGLELVVLAHLSETNNHPEKALESADRVLQTGGIEKPHILIGSQHTPGPMVGLHPYRPNPTLS